MFNWIKSLFTKKKPHDPLVNEIISKLNVGDMVELTLREDFCHNMLRQNQSRFDEDDLNTRSIKGIVVKSGFNDVLQCHLLELQTIKKKPWGVNRYILSILGNEIEKIRTVE